MDYLVTKENENGYRLRIFLISLFMIVGFGLQIEAVTLHLSIFHGLPRFSLITVCFYSPYEFSWLVQLIGIVSLALSGLTLRYNDWKPPSSFNKQLVLVSPLLVLMTDQLIRYTI